jgi:type IV secretory pathway VirB2 component (pilin)
MDRARRVFKKWLTPEIALLGLMIVGGMVALFAPDVWAQARGKGLDRIETKFEEIHGYIRGAAGVIVAIGVIWLGLKAIKGDQDTKTHAIWVIIGGVIVGGSGEIAKWIMG